MHKVLYVVEAVPTIMGIFRVIREMHKSFWEKKLFYNGNFNMNFHFTAERDSQVEGFPSWNVHRFLDGFVLCLKCTIPKCENGLSL